MEFYRRKLKRKVRVADIFIGGDAPITVQSMTNTDTRDIKASVEQIKSLEDAGCDIVRLAIPDMEAASAIEKIKNQTNIPLVADIHFDYRLGMNSIEKGADKIRFNPGNIGGEEEVKSLVKLAKSREIPIRIGVNSGSVEKDLISKYGGVKAEALVESALRHVEILKRYDYHDIVISIKASNVAMTVEAYKLISNKTDYPLHLGVTEAGNLIRGTIKSSLAMGILLSEGIGDTLRISLTGNPVDEVKVGREILRSLDIKKEGIEIISCPTCGRCNIDLISIVEEVERRIDEDKVLSKTRKNIKLAMMGCIVNGPGEAKEADLGIAGGTDQAVLFKEGKVIRKIPQKNIVDQLILELKKMI